MKRGCGEAGLFLTTKDAKSTKDDQVICQHRATCDIHGKSLCFINLSLRKGADGEINNAMKKPAGMKELSLHRERIESAYPPIGFHAFSEGELGNGDYFGLYWPYGKENVEPIVCDMLHDEWGLELSFSSLAKFLEWFELNDEERGDEEVDDPDHVAIRYNLLKSKLQSAPEEAVKALESICEDFPEHAEYWFSLAGQLRRTGRTEDSVLAARNAFLSNWIFAQPPQGALRMLMGAQKKGIMTNDPLVSVCSEINFKFGGEKENAVYSIFSDLIAAYLELDPVRGLLLNQNYGYMMMSETVSFQERYAFNVKEWVQKHEELCVTHLGESRNTID